MSHNVLTKNSLNMKNSLTILLFVVLSMVFVSCTKEAQVVAPVAAPSTNELLAYKTTQAPTIDGTIDAIWANAQVLELSPTVPDPGNNLFAGYIGDKYAAKIKTMYDAENIYFLVEYGDIDKNLKVSPWYFDPVKKLWATEGKSKTIDVNGITTREGFGDDKISFLWNIDNSTPKFSTQTCYATCHVFTPYLDYTTVGTLVARYGQTAKDSLVVNPTYKSNAGSGNHYTNGAAEKVDQWWLHPLRGFAYGVMDDNYQDWAGGPAVTGLTGGNANGRHYDDLIPTTASTTWPYRPGYTSDATQGSVANSQSLKLDGTGASVTVPKYVFPTSSAKAGNVFISIADTTSGDAVRVVAVSSTGVLTLVGGGTIDPTSGTDYQRVGVGVGAKCFPSNIISPVTNGRADINATAIHSGTGWVIEFKRKLKTTDVLKQDVDFSSLDDQPFGFALWNKNNNQHAIVPGLKLKFQK